MPLCITIIKIMITVEARATKEDIKYFNEN